MPVEKLVLGPYKSGIAPHELMTSITLKPLDGYRVGLRRLSIRAALAISRLSVVWAVRENRGAFEDVRIAIGSCTPVPFRARAAEALLRGKGDKSGGVDEAVETHHPRHKGGNGGEAHPCLQTADTQKHPL